MSKVNKIETAVRYLLACVILSAPLLPAQAQQYQTYGPQAGLDQSSAPLFAQPNYQGDLRQHSFFAGDYRYPIQTGVGTDDMQLYWWQNLTLQNTYSGPTPISTGLIGDNIDTTVQGSVPGLVSAVVSGAVTTAGVAGSAVAGSGTTAAASSAGTAASGTSANVNGSVVNGF